MVGLDAEGRRKRAQMAALKARHPDKPDLWADHLREMRVAAAERHIQKLVSEFPTATPEQRARLAELLVPGRVAPPAAVDGGAA